MQSHDKPQDLLKKLEALESHLTAVESDYQRVLALNEEAHLNEKKYLEEINRLSQILSQQASNYPNFDEEIKKYRDLLLGKE